jgi:predicted HNH restriction endonuclease
MDFDEQLLSANVPILADYRDLPSDTETEAPSAHESAIAMGQSPVSAKQPTAVIKNDVADFEYEEGLRREAERSFFQRNDRLGQQAKEIYGCICQVCGFDFAKTYGVLGQNFAEVHHLNPLSERPPDEWTTAVRTNVTEVAVICSNCHSMIHRRKPALSVEELRAIVGHSLHGRRTLNRDVEVISSGDAELIR